MLRRWLVLVVAAVVLAGCAAKSPVARDSLREEIRKTLRENPDLVLDVVREHHEDVLRAVEQAARERHSQEQAERYAKALANPLKPAIDADRPMLGAPDAPVTIVAYSDFLCPYCARGAANIRRLLEKRPRDIRFFFKHLPLHPMSMELAETFEALALRDEALAWTFHDRAFAEGGKLESGGEDALKALLREIGADPARVARDRKDRRVADRIARDVQEAGSFNVDGTPSFLINGVLVAGAVPVEEMDAVVAAALKATADATICRDCPRR
ncbi:thioredoxin domain-containing protein [Desulfovibrio aminophilus]|nr:thioredoxin domain-containing protein [Desulfovibrio aminophilus]MCM0756898.1 thioredoxin domain-containing protein [Desulfovibrio aminophilus]